MDSYQIENFYFIRFNAWIKAGKAEAVEDWCKSNSSDNCLYNLFKALHNTRGYLADFYQSSKQEDWDYGRIHKQMFPH
jgi:hypothetical protein